MQPGTWRSCTAIESHDAPGRAEVVLKQLGKAFSAYSAGQGAAQGTQSGCASTARFFSIPRYLRVLAETVYVLVIADGRRDMQTLRSGVSSQA